MKNKTAKRAIASYYILSLLLTLPLLIPIGRIKEYFGMAGYLLFLLIYTKIVLNIVARITIMSSLWKDLDAETYAAIINAKAFRVHYSYKLNLYFATGDYQAAYNIISSVMIRLKNIQQRIYGHLLICRICFERGDYEGLKKQLTEIDNYFKNNPNKEFPKRYKEAYEVYRAFSGADYVTARDLLEKGVEKISKKKNRTYFSLLRQYELAVAKRMNGDMDEAAVLFEGIKEKAPKLALSSLAQRQLEYMDGTLEETVPEQLEVTENCVATQPRGAKAFRVVMIIVFCLYFLLGVAEMISVVLDTPEQEYKDLDYIASLEGSIEDDYEEYQILGYFDIYTDYADETYTMRVDSLFLVESNGQLDLHTPYTLNGEYMNLLNVKDIQVDKLYKYKIYFSPQEVEFVLTEKERNIPENTLYYYEIDGYYFCVISIFDI